MAGITGLVAFMGTAAVTGFVKTGVAVTVGFAETTGVTALAGSVALK